MTEYNKKHPWPERLRSKHPWAKRPWLNSSVLVLTRECHRDFQYQTSVGVFSKVLDLGSKEIGR